MAYISEFSLFNDCSLEIINFKYPPLVEYLNRMEELRYNCIDDDLKLSVYTKLKDGLNRILSGRPLQHSFCDELLDYFKQCGNHGLKRDFFDSGPKRLFRLLKNHIKLDKLLADVITEVLAQIPNDILYIYCSDENYWQFIISNLSDQQRVKVRPVNRKTVRHKYINGSLLIIGPAFWYSDFLSFPSAEFIFIAQPSGFHNPNILQRDILNGPNTVNLWAGNKSNISISKTDIDIKASDEYELESQESPEHDNEYLPRLGKSFVADITGVQSSINNTEVTDKYGRLNYVQLNRNYLTVTANGNIENLAFDEDEKFIEIKYIVTEIDHSQMTHADVDNELKVQMERWKKPLRDYMRPYELPNELKALGALKANSQNIRNWSRQDSIAPMYYEDFIAVLTFANIDRKEFDYFFRLAKLIRSKSISVGHKKSDISKEIVKKEIFNKLKAGEDLPDILKIGNIKAHILEPKSESNG